VRGATQASKTDVPEPTGKEVVAVHRNGKISWRPIGVLLLALLFVVVLLQNTQVGRIHLFFWTLSMSRIILLCFALLVGFAVEYRAMGRSKAREKTYLIRRAKGDLS
jgi:uncharacterized integral membrane protein